MSLVVVFSFQLRLTCRESVGKLLSCSIQLFLQWSKSSFVVISESQDVSCWGAKTNSTHTTYITFVFSEKEAALRLPQLDVRFLADSHSWNVSGTPNVRAVRQMRKSTAPELSFGNILVAYSLASVSVWLKPNFKY